jgi:hypothetical protein
MVKVQNVEGVATRDVPESCASLLGNHGREALTGVRAGRVLSRERILWGADPVGERGRPHRLYRHREAHPGPARSKTPCMHGGTLHGNREVPCLPVRDGEAGCIGKSKDVRR